MPLPRGLSGATVSPVPASKEPALSSPAVEGFEYVGWHEDVRLPADDEDREWCVVFVVLASSEQQAQEWGDEVSRRHAQGHGDVFLHSSAEPHVCGAGLVPGERHACTNYRLTSGELVALAVVQSGADVSDDFIGW